VQNALDNALEILGVSPEAFVSFDSLPTARHLRYMDLLQSPAGVPAGEPVLLPEGVVEVGGKAAVYVIRAHLLEGGEASAQVAALTRTLACRADAAYLAVISPGVTTIYQVGFFSDGVIPPIEAVIEPRNAIGLRNLLDGYEANSPQAQADRLWLDDLLFKLLTDSATALQTDCSVAVLADGTVLSLIGRALFTRFLVDRRIVRDADIGAISPGIELAENLFSNIDSLVNTFKWLDHTFNGDLLDLGTKDYSALMVKMGAASVSICVVLSNIMSRAPDGQLSLDWGGLKFQHIPVDVLSQVYEHFAHRFTPDIAKETSIHYTPRGIAELLVDGVFSATPSAQRYSARVLDPAVGAGVFLVLAFRRLVAEHWLHFGSRPLRAEIRQILAEQLCGLDINSTSIKVAALSLYLAALELDPEPMPLDDLRFEKLFGTTLRCVDGAHLGNVPDAHLGSLSRELLSIGTFDIVLGNPPWTRLPGTFKKLLDQTPWHKDEMPQLGAKSLVPNQWPDLAFIWRSTQWCKSGGVIGMLVHARLLFSEEAAGVRARLFSKTRVTGVLNGMHLRKERKIWPSNSQPFCAFVSINEPAEVHGSFYFLTPRNEPTLARRREFRLDPRSAIPVPSACAVNDLHTFKTLARGSALDLDLVGRIRCKPRISMMDYFGLHGLEIRQGFIAGENNLLDATELKGLPVLEGGDKPHFSVSTAQLAKIETRYPQLRFQWPRNRTIYSGKHLLFREAPKQDTSQRGAVLTDGDVAFSRSFYGITIPEHLETVGDYLYVLSYSDLLAYWVLMTSSKFGVERDIFNIKDFGNFPLTQLDLLSKSIRSEVSDMAVRVRAGHRPWDDLNDLVARIYSLSIHDGDLVRDALEYEAPYTGAQANGLRLVEQEAVVVKDFAGSLAAIISESEGVTVTASACEISIDDGGWQFLRVSCDTPPPLDVRNAQELLRCVGEPLMSSEIRLELGPKDWLVGRLRHERYWTRSQARLLALDLIERGLFSDSSE
jgi:hypothetical protein